MANRQYNVNINNGELNTLKLNLYTGGREGNGRIDYTNTINKETGRKLYLLPYSTNPSYKPVVLRSGLTKRKSPSDETTDSYAVTIFGTTSTYSMSNGDAVNGDNPVIPLYKDATAYSSVSGDPQSDSLDCTFVQGDENYELTAEVMSSIDITGAEFEISGPYSGATWNGSTMADSGVDYGTYSYTDGDGVVQSGTIDGGETFADIINDAAKSYDGTEASCLNINFSAVTTPTLSGYGGVICPSKVYTKKFNEVGKKDDIFTLSGAYFYEVCDSFAEFDIEDVVDGSQSISVDFTGASSATTKYLFLLNDNFIDDLTITKDGSTFDKEVVQCIKITYTP